MVGLQIEIKRRISAPKDKIIDISDNEYYIRWSLTSYIYMINQIDTDPRNVSFLDASYNNGISPYTYFDFREYGNIQTENQ